MSQVHVTHHARQRAGERLPELCERYGHDAVVRMIAAEVHQAAFLNLFTRKPPGWCRMRRIRRSDGHRYRRFDIDCHEITAVVARKGNDWHVLTVVTRESGRAPRHVALPPVPVLPCGRTIGLPIRCALPPATAALVAVS